MLPSVFSRDLFDEFFDDEMFSPMFPGYNRNNDLMRTDVRETAHGYEVVMDLPGIKKEDVKADLKDGYLTIEAATRHSNDEKDDKGRYIRRERYAGAFSRSFYVGEDVTHEEIKAKFENGTLILQIPKKDTTPKVKEKNYIAIEG